MPYILYKNDGTVLTSVDDSTLDTTTELSFVGRNYSGYGQIVNENFVKLLESFSGTTQPAKPLQGQLWFNKTNKTLNYSHNGTGFKELANMYVQSSAPNLTEVTIGDLWWDTTNAQLKVFDGYEFPSIGPISPATSKAFWSPDVRSTDLFIDSPILKATLDNNVVAVASLRDYTATTPSDEYNSGFTTLKQGISLPGADSEGSTEGAGYYFWGSSAHSLRSNTSTHAIAADFATTSTFSSVVAITQEEVDNTNYFLTFASTTTGNIELFSSGNISYNPSTQVLNATATAAYYADLAERYYADNQYDVGTVVVIGGLAEVTISTERADTAVAGIVSQNPAYRMNSEAGPDQTHPYIALKGRLPCKVKGPIKKGQLLVSSSQGHAEAWKPGDDPNAVVGKALESFEGPHGIIEVKV